MIHYLGIRYNRMQKIALHQLENWEINFPQLHIKHQQPPSAQILFEYFSHYFTSSCNKLEILDFI